jgi:RNA polymerase sigma factor (sigma-70 family)
MHDMADENLLEQLGTANAGAAWTAFLRRYTPLIVGVVRQYQRDAQSLNDCYLFICEKLIDDDFRRLRAWRNENVRFASWLRAVVANLCVDWHRSVQGRRRPFRSFADLTGPERLVCIHRFKFGASLRECHEAVVVAYPQLSELDVAAMIRRMNGLLSPQQHWMLANRRRAAVSLDDTEIRRQAEQTWDSQETPEELAVAGQQQERLHAALRQLTTSQQLLLKLRYQQGLSLKEVARLAGYENLQQARYQIRLALERLQTLLSDG